MFFSFDLRVKNYMFCVFFVGKTHHVASVGPRQAESAVHISSLVSHILVQFVDGGGGGQVDRQPLTDGLGIGGVLHYTQHSGLLCCTFNL